MNLFYSVQTRIFMAGICWLLVTVSAAGVITEMQFLESCYDNRINVESTSTKPIGIFLHSGGNADTVAQAPGVGGPGQGDIRLLRSSLGAMTPRVMGYPGAFEDLKAAGEAAADKLDKLFDAFYVNKGTSDAEDIRFNFDFFLTSEGDHQAGDPTLPTASLFDEASAAEAQRAFYAAWRINPSDKTVLHGLLDVPYFRSVGLIMLGNLDLEKAFSVRFLQAMSKNPGNVILDEMYSLGWDDTGSAIVGDRGAWQYFDKAGQIWLDVFNDPVQRDILKRLQPERSLVQTASAFSKKEPVYDGYKDAAAMLRALAQRSKTTKEIARRLILMMKRDQASLLVETHARDIMLLRNIIFQELSLEPVVSDAAAAEKFPGLAESLAEFSGTMEALTTTRYAALNERWNALGFDKDLAVVVPGSQAEDAASTYDWLRNQIFNPDTNQPKGTLQTASVAEQSAEEYKKNFILNATSYLNEFGQIEDQYNERLVDLCGGTLDAPNIERPDEGGGLIQNQLYNVQKASNNIERVTRLMENVHNKIDIECWRVAEVNGILDQKAELVIKVGNETAKLSQEIANIQGDMALANGLAQAATAAISGSWGSGAGAAAVNVANAFVQRQMHRRIGEKQAQMQKIQAQKEADFIKFDQGINDINSQAQIKTWLLDLYTYEIDLIDAQLTLQQEMERLAQYVNQIDVILALKDRAESRLARKSLADPTYRIEVTRSALYAENMFEKAQFWTYLTVRALEYKWAEDFSRNTQLAPYISKVVACRMAGDPLKPKTNTLLDILSQLNTWDSGQRFSGFNHHYWNFSLKKDYLGMTFGKEMPGSAVIKSPEDQFREYLVDLRENSRITLDNGAILVKIPFSTVRFKIEGKDLTNLSVENSYGQSVSAQGTPVFDARLWNDKIDSVSVDIVGDKVYTPDAQSMPITLEYAGTGFLRTQSNFTIDGKYVDYRAYPMTNVEFSLTPTNFKWTMKDYLKDAFTAKLVTSPRDIPDFVFKTANFRERPVACTSWALYLPLDGTNFENIRDIRIGILHRAYTRQKK